MEDRRARRWRTTATATKTAQALRTDAQKEKEAPADIDEIVKAAVEKAVGEVGPKRKKMPKATPVDHAQVLDRRPRGLHHSRHVRGRHRRRDLHITDVGKEGSTLRGMMNSFATAISIALQYGVPLETLVQKFAYMRFEPEGITQNPEIPFAKSMPDYIMRWLASRFLDAEVQEELGILTPAVRAKKMAEEAATSISSDTATPTNGGGSGASDAQPAAAALHRLAAGPAGPHGRPGPRPGVLAVRRHDAAHGLVLHVLQLREQHWLRLSFGPPPNASRARALCRALVVARLADAGSVAPRDSPPVGVRSMSRPLRRGGAVTPAVPTPGRLMARRPSAVRVIEVASAT